MVVLAAFSSPFAGAVSLMPENAPSDLASAFRTRSVWNQHSTTSARLSKFALNWQTLAMLSYPDPWPSFRSLIQGNSSLSSGGYLEFLPNRTTALIRPRPVFDKLPVNPSYQQTQPNTFPSRLIRVAKHKSWQKKTNTICDNEFDYSAR